MPARGGRRAEPAATGRLLVNQPGWGPAGRDTLNDTATMVHRLEADVRTLRKAGRILTMD